MTTEDPLTTAAEHRLEAERPVPRAGFRAELRARLLELERRRDVSPRRIRLLIGAYATSGTLLLLIVAIGVAGTGPLAA